MAILTQTHNGLKFVGTSTSILNDNGQQIMKLIGTSRTNTKVGVGPQTPTSAFTVHDIQDTSYFSGISIHQYQETYTGQQPHHFFNAVGGSLNLVADSVKNINIMQGQDGNHVAIFKHIGSSAYRMGLGIENPDAKLHIYGGTANTEIFLGEDGVADKVGIIKYNQGDGNGIGTLQLGHWGDTLATNGMTIKKGGKVGIGTDDPEQLLHVVGVAKITGDLLLGETGTTPKIDMMFEDISTGPGYDRRIHIGKSDDLPNTNSYPTYTGAGGYGVQFQSHSDGAFFGIIPYATNNYRPVINWGDDTTDSPFAFQFNGVDVFKVTTSGKVAGTGHSWDAFKPQGLSGTEGVGSETSKLVLSGASINFKGAGGSGSTNLQIDGTTFLSSGLALTINSGTLGGNEIATYPNVFRTGANVGSHGTAKYRNTSNLYPEPAAELINAATGNPFNNGIIADSLMYKDVESYSYDGSSWADCSSETDFSGLVVPNTAHAWNGVSLQRDQDDYIMYFSSGTSYSFNGWLLMMHSTNGNNFSYKIETTDTNPDTLAKKTENVGGSTGWSVIGGNLDGAISSWPGYTIDKIHLRTGSTSDDYVRIRVTPNWNSSYTTTIDFGKIGMYASYGYFLKPASVNKDQRFRFNYGIGIGGVYGVEDHYINANISRSAGMFNTFRNDTGFVLNRSYADHANDGTDIEYQERIGVDGNSASVGTFGAHKFSLRTSNTDALVVDTDGKIGINTASNSAEETNNGVPRLQVTTATAALGEFPLAARFTTAADAGNNSGVSVLINSGNDRGLMISAGREVENVAKVTLNVVENNGNELDTITMKQSSAGASSAYVGIGTETPAEKLEVSGSVKVGNVKLEPANGGRLGFNRNTSNGAIYDANYGAFQINGAAANAEFLGIESYNSSGTFQGLISVKAGKLGIGTNDPSASLNIKGNGHYAKWTEGTNNYHVVEIGADSSGDGVINLRDSGNGIKVKLYAEANADNYINNGGNFGIGNATPGQKLHVDNGAVRVENTGTGLGGFISVGNKTETAGNYSAYFFGNTNEDSTYFKGGIAYETLASTNGRGDMHFLQNSATNSTNATISDSVMTILNGGNIGIANVTPRTALDFSTIGTSSQVSNISLPVYNGPSGGGGTNIGSALQWYPHYSGYTKRSAGIAQIAEGHYFRSGLAFYTNNSANTTGDWGERMRINMDGDLGVGNSAPKEKLDVQGSMVLGREHGISQLHNNLGFNKLTPGLIWREYDYTESPTVHVTSSDSFNTKIKDHTTFTESGIATIVNGFTRSDDTYIVEFVGYYFAEEAGTHLFSVSADDSTDMFIDGKRVAFWYGGHGDNSAATGGTLGSGSGTVQTPGSIYLEKGYHRIYTRFHEVTGGDSINLWHQAPSDTAYEVIPAANLWHEAADRAMSTEHGVEFHEAVVSAKEFTAFNGILNLDDNGTHDGVINAKASLTINIDADNNATGEAFRINKNTTNVDSTPLLQISESMVTRFNAQQNSGSRIELFNNRQDQSNVEVFRIAAYNSVESSGIHFYRGGGGDSGYATVYSKKSNTSNLERVVKFGGDNTLDATFAADVIAYSDERVKENIETLDGKKVLEMRGVSYNRTDQDGRFSSGVIAQELEKVAPELVKDDGDLKAVAYGNLTGYLIEAIKDQQKQIDELKKIIKNGNNL
jgi:hypothetical protein